MIGAHFNTALFTNGDSTQPELAGVLGAVVGSALMLLVTALIAIPLGVGAAICTWKSSRRKNKLTDLIEVNINNLAAVPSIVYGLLGLALFINWMHLPRASPWSGGTGPGPDGPADDHHRHPLRAEGGAALDPRGGPGHGRVQDPDRVPATSCRWPCPAS